MVNNALFVDPKWKAYATFKEYHPEPINVNGIAGATGLFKLCFFALLNLQDKVNDLWRVVKPLHHVLSKMVTLLAKVKSAEHVS